jgi:glutamine phosphoribosylpyrophosphate amidotransferase
MGGADPDLGAPALGFARETGIPELGIIRNHYVGALSSSTETIRRSASSSYNANRAVVAENASCWSTI